METEKSWWILKHIMMIFWYELSIENIQHGYMFVYENIGINLWYISIKLCLILRDQPLSNFHIEPPNSLAETLQLGTEVDPDPFGRKLSTDLVEFLFQLYI